MKNAPLIIAFLFALGCKEGRTPGSAFEDYENDNVTVIGGDDSSATGDERITLSGPQGEGKCVEVSDNLCVPVETQGEWCEREGGPVDIVVVDGEVVEVICYPPPGNDGKPEEIVDSSQSGNIDILQNANNTAVVFDPATNGVPIVADLSVDGNNVSVYGNGPDQTILDGDVTVDGNNVRLRGLTITGNLTMSLNNTSIVLCAIRGNVVMNSEATNGSVFVENDVFGTFTSDSNNNTLAGNDVQGTWSVTGHANICDANYAFGDADQDWVVGDGERGDRLTCN
jgi:hypothetical protein